jgi:hypothetical protein
MRGWVTFGLNIVCGGFWALFAVSVANGWAPPSALVIVGFVWLALDMFVDAGEGFKRERIERDIARALAGMRETLQPRDGEDEL